MSLGSSSFKFLFNKWGKESLNSCVAFWIISHSQSHNTHQELFKKLSHLSLFLYLFLITIVLAHTGNILWDTGHRKRKFFTFLPFSLPYFVRREILRNTKMFLLSLDHYSYDDPKRLQVPIHVNVSGFKSWCARAYLAVAMVIAQLANSRE